MDLDDRDRTEPAMGTLPKEWDETQAYLRAADRLRLEGMVHGLRQEGMSLLLCSERPALVDHYGRMLVRRLRSLPDLRVEVIFPTTTDMLLARFNQWLAEIPITEAQAAPQPEAMTRVFVVHDAEAVAETELQVMARLAVDFPGLCVRVVLLMGDEGDVARRRALLGRRVLQWTVETPEEKELEHLLNQAADAAQREAMQQWLTRLGLMDSANESAELDVWVRPSWAVPPEPSQAVIRDYEPPEETEIEAPPSAPSAAAMARWRRRKWLGLVALGLGVLGLSAALVMAWYRADALPSTSALQSAPLKPILPEASKD